jgi:hypothetical protein
MFTSPKGLGPEKHCAGKDQQHIQKIDPSSRQRWRPTKVRPCQRVTNNWSWAPDGDRHKDLLTDWSSVAMCLWLEASSKQVRNQFSASSRWEVNAVTVIFQRRVNNSHGRVSRVTCCILLCPAPALLGVDISPRVWQVTILAMFSNIK